MEGTKLSEEEQKQINIALGKFLQKNGSKTIEEYLSKKNSSNNESNKQQSDQPQTFTLSKEEFNKLKIQDLSNNNNDNNENKPNIPINFVDNTKGNSDEDAESRINNMENISEDQKKQLKQLIKREKNKDKPIMRKEGEEMKVYSNKYGTPMTVRQTVFCDQQINEKTKRREENKELTDELKELHKIKGISAKEMGTSGKKHSRRYRKHK